MEDVRKAPGFSFLGALAYLSLSTRPTRWAGGGGDTAGPALFFLFSSGRLTDIPARKAYSGRETLNSLLPFSGRDRRLDGLDSRSASRSAFDGASRDDVCDDDGGAG